MVTTEVLSVSEIEKRILKYVATHPGCTDLEILQNATISGDNFSLDLPEILGRFVNEGQLTELQYSSVSNSNNLRICFYPANSTLELGTDTQANKVTYTDSSGFKFHKLLPSHIYINIVKN